MQLLQIIDKHTRHPENLIHILLEYQQGKEQNFISEEDVMLIANEMSISESRIYSVISFYSLFSTKPRGKYVIQVCSDVPCHVNGSLDVVKELENKLKVKMGETTPDKVFSLEYTSCIGCCDKAPAIRIGSEMYSNLTASSIAEIITDFRRKYNENR